MKSNLLGEYGGRRWVIASIYRHETYTQVKAWEKHDDGQFTAWDYSLYGAVGSKGKLKADAKVTIRDAKNTKKDKALIDEVLKLLDAGLKRSQAMFNIAKLQGVKS